MVNIGLVYDQLRPDERLIIEAAKNNGIQLDLFDTNQMAFEVTGKQTGLEDTDVTLKQRFLPLEPSSPSRKSLHSEHSKNLAIQQ